MVMMHLWFIFQSFCVWNSESIDIRPKFLEGIPNVNVTSGRDVSLPCVVDNIGNYKVAWTHINRHLLLTIDTEVVTLIPRFRVTRDDPKTWTLHINDVKPDDTGYYACQVNIEPIMNQVGHIQVVVPPTFVDELGSPSHVVAQEMTDLELTCAATGFPAPSISWAKEKGQLITKTGSVPKGNKLRLGSVSRKDMGAYLCIASNKVPPSVSKRIVVDVHFSPVITVPNQLVGAPIGTSVELECRVSAYPNAVNYWEFMGQLLLNGTDQQTTETQIGYKTTLRLRLFRLKMKDYGTYVCGSKNSLGETESHLKLYKIAVTNGAMSNGISPKQMTNKSVEWNNSHLSYTKLMSPSSIPNTSLEEREGEEEGTSLQQPDGDDGRTRNSHIFPMTTSSSHATTTHQSLKYIYFSHYEIIFPMFSATLYCQLFKTIFFRGWVFQ